MMEQENLNETVVPKMGPRKLRQMNLPECYKKIKLSKFRFSSPFNVTLDPTQIDSDSDEENGKIAETEKKIPKNKLEDSKILTQIRKRRIRRIQSDEEEEKIAFNLRARTKKKIPNKLETPVIPTQIKKKNSDIKNNNKTSSTSNLKPIPKTNNNFKIFSTVSSKQYLKSLLSGVEIEILDKIHELDFNSQIILLKLHSEKFDWHNVYEFCEKTHIKEEKNLIEKFEHLHHQCFIDIDKNANGNMETYELLQKLDHKKLKEIIKENKIIKCTKYSNENMIDSIVNACTNQKTLTGKSYKYTITESIKKKYGFNIKFLNQVYESIKNLYILETLFNNKIQNVKNYIDTITTNTTLPKVPLEESYPIFPSRNNFLNYTKAKNMQQNFENILSSNSIRQQKLAAIKDLGEEIYNELATMDFQNFHPNAPHMNIFTDQFLYINLLSKSYEKIYKNYTLEGKKWLEFLINKFPNSRKFGYWNYQLILLYMRHLEEIDLKSATRLLVQVFSSFSDKLSEADKHNLAYLGEILKSNKTINEIFFERLSEMAPAPISLQAFLQKEFSSEVSVTRKINKETGFTHLEQVALNFYCKTVYRKGKNCQILFSAFFVAYFWDLIFNPLKNPAAAFLSQLQSAPLDFYDQHFYANRKLEIDGRLKDIEENWSRKEFIDFGKANFENNCCYQLLLLQDADFLKSRMIAVDDFQEIAECIGPRILAGIFRRLIQNLSDSISDVPNLFVWNPTTKSCKFVEVKNSRAKISVEKLLWLRDLQNIGALVEIFNVKNPSKKNDATVEFEETSVSEEEEEIDEEN